MKTLKSIIDWIVTKVGSVAMPTGWLGVVWSWVSWSIVGIATSIYNFFISPKVWPAAGLFFVVGWIASFNWGQRHPEPQRVAVAQPNGQAVDLDVCRTQLGQMDDRFKLALSQIDALKKQAETLKSVADAKPKVVYRTRRAAPAKADDGFTINWPKF